jgi:DNA-binding response OmpR family regulator
MTIDIPVVLVIEDDPPMRELLDVVLREEGYQVVAVHDGATAIDVLESLKVDLITLDLDLPGLTGSDLLQVLRHRKMAIPPIIIITSYVPVKRSLQKMAQKIIAKPFDIDDLVSAVLQLLPSRLAKPVGGTEMRQ